jgi:hypothetical protein
VKYRNDHKDEKLSLSVEQIEELVYHLDLRFILYFSEEIRKDISINEIEDMINTMIDLHPSSPQMFLNLIKRLISNAESLELSHQFIFRKIFEHYDFAS